MRKKHRKKISKTSKNKNKLFVLLLILFLILDFFYISNRSGVHKFLLKAQEPQGSTVPCATLGSIWTGGKAVYDNGRYNVSKCTNSTMAEMVKPAQRDSRWQDARCNDGTPFGFHIQFANPRSNKWLVFLTGGGFCDDNMSDCSHRIPKYTSTPAEADRELKNNLLRQGIFNTNPVNNPTFYNFNHVYAYYCSSDVWSGNTTSRRPNHGDPVNGWYFSGKYNVKAMWEILIQRYGLNPDISGTQILFGGESAGGLGAQSNAYEAYQLFTEPTKLGNFKIVNDAGMIWDFDDPNYRPGDANTSIKEAFAYAYDFWGSSLNPLCEKDQLRQGKRAGYCFHEPTIYPFIVNSSADPVRGLGIPLLLQYCSIDSWALEIHKIVWPDDQTAVEEYRQSTLQSFNDLQNAWLFSGGETPYHAITLNNQKWIMGPPGNTYRELLTRFWQGNPPEKIIFGNP